MALVLDVQIGNTNRSFLLTGEDVTVGTAGGNSLRVNDSTVSAHHCVITLEDGQVFIRDLQSKSGTWVNGEIIREKTAVVAGDVIAIGPIVVLLRENGDGESDLYTKWLSIPPKPRPVDHYMLLGVAPYTSDVELLHESANRRLEALEKYVLTSDRQRRDACQNMMNEVALAVTTLTDLNRRPAYEATVAERYPIQLEIAPVNSSDDDDSAARNVIDWRSLPDLDDVIVTPDALPFSEMSRHERRLRRSPPNRTKRQFSAVLTALVGLVVGAAVIVVLNSRSRPTDRRMPLDDPAASASSPSTETSPKIGTDLKSTTIPPIAIIPPGVQVLPSKATPPPSPSRLRLEIAEGQTVEMILIEPGEFNMGSPANEVSRESTETQHKVKIAKAFFMGIHEVTQGQYKAITGQSPSNFKGSDDLPVDQVNWEDAVAFCQKLSEKTGKKVRLPTEAEWEYACRAGTTTPFSFGNTISTDEANYRGNTNYRGDNATYGNGVKGVDRGKTIPVGSLEKPNAWGLHDMHGNLWEWCSSKHADYPYRADDGREEGGDNKTSRVVRGGSFYFNPNLCRSAYRTANPADYRNYNIGFRIVLELSQEVVVNVDRPIKIVSTEEILTVLDGGGKSTEVDLGGGIKMELVRIEPGEFNMGSPANEVSRESTETQHKVKIAKAFYMGIHEVTQGQYKAITGQSPSNFKGSDDLPVGGVSWEDAVSFCQNLTKKTGRKVRLPTEAEWEYACRAGTTTPFHFGNTISTDEANYNGNVTYGSGVKGVYREKTIPVGSLKKPNKWGLHDMHGNVWEWCSDWHGDYPNDAVTDPTGPQNGTSRVLRGGSWYHHPEGCRSAYRIGYSPGNRNIDFGFRVVLELSQEVVVNVDRPIKIVSTEEIRTVLDGGGKSTEVDLGGDVKIKMIWIPAGQFRMGSPADEKGRQVNEAQKTVAISNDFYLGESEVTQSQWKTVMKTTPWKGNAYVKEGDDYPATYVSWDDAQEFLMKLSKTSGKKLRLPTEAEWEYACRAGTQFSYYFGSNEADLGSYAWWGGITGVGNANNERYAHQMKTKKPNAWRLYDMHGNVAEWCLDEYAPSVHIVRGGSWGQPSVDLRSAARDRSADKSRISTIGFRIVLELDPTNNEASILNEKTRSSLDLDSSVLSIGEGVKLKLVKIEAGEFPKGSDTELKVERIDRGFYLGETEVTQAQWKAVMSTTPWKGMGNIKEGDDYPATVSWDDAQEFLQVLSKTSGRKVRLPMEAEWEYACRAGTKTRYFFGDSDRDLGDYAWWGGHSGGGSVKNDKYAHQVKTKQPNPWGLYDMYGNVWEWCEERYDTESRVLRGGTWYDAPWSTRSANRYHYPPNARFYTIGFRVVVD